MKKQDTKAHGSAPASPEPPPPVKKREPTTLPIDQFHGKGGCYEMVDGVRRRVAEPPAEDTTA